MQDCELGCNAADGVGCIGPWAGDKVEGAGTLAVETKVLGKGLRHAELETLRDEVADRPSVVFKIARREALICAVEKGEVLLCCHRFGELGPLGVGKVDTGGVVGTGMQENDASLGGLLERGEHAREIKAFGLRGEIWVGFDRQVHVGENLVVVGPCWGGEVDGLVRAARIELGEEKSAQVDSTGARDGLEARYLEMCGYNGSMIYRQGRSVSLLACL